MHELCRSFICPVRLTNSTARAMNGLLGNQGGFARSMLLIICVPSPRVHTELLTWLPAEHTKTFMRPHMCRHAFPSQSKMRIAQMPSFMIREGFKLPDVASPNFSPTAWHVGRSMKSKLYCGQAKQAASLAHPSVVRITPSSLCSS